MRRLGLAALALGVVASCAPSAAPAPQPGSGAGPSAPADAPAAGSSAHAYLPAPGETPTSIRVATCAVAGGFVHLYTALEAGLFEKYGFRVEHTVIRGSGPSLSALAVNEVQFLYCAGDATIPGMASGIPAKLVATPLQGIPYVMVARPEARSVLDLRGKAIGITRPGDLSDRLSRRTVEQFGLRPNVDVELRPIGGSIPERYQAMLGNVVQAVAITPPLDAQARKDGQNVIYDLAELGLPYISTSVHTSNTLIRDDPRTVQRFVAAIAETLHFVDKHPDVARRAMGKVMDVDDPDVLESAYQAYGRKLVERRMAIPFEVVVETIDEAREQGTQITVSGPEEVATNQFVEELERSGFLAALWDAEPPPR